MVNRFDVPSALNFYKFHNIMFSVKKYNFDRYSQDTELPPIDEFVFRGKHYESLLEEQTVYSFLGIPFYTRYKFLGGVEVMPHNVLQLAEGGVFEAPSVKLRLMFIQSRKVSATTSAPLLARCCYSQFFSFRHCHFSNL